MKIYLNGIFDENLSSSLSIKKYFKQGDALSPLLFNFALEYAIMKAQEINLELDMTGIHRVLAYAVVVNLIRELQACY